jgi:WYL domain-containing protein
LLRTDLATARREVFPAVGVLAATVGGVLLRSEVDDLGWLALELARLPFAFEIVGPQELRQAVLAHAQSLARLATLSPASSGEGAATSDGASTATCDDAPGSRLR